jgi:hypothetical protein
LYEKRCRIATFVAAQKSRGFHMHTSHISDAQRLSRLFIAACLAYKSDIPHRGPDFGEFLSIKPCIPLAQELEEVLVLVGQIQHYESLSRNVEHMVA